MNRKGISIAAIAALVGAIVGVVAAMGWQKSSASIPARIERDSSSSSQLGAQILGKVGGLSVAHRRVNGQGVVFYDQPKPYGDWLCRVNRYFVPEKTLTGKTELPQDWWADDLAIEREYGIWRRPTLGRASDSARHKACQPYRDFDHLFSASESADPERAAFLLDSILTNLRSDELRIPITCDRFTKDGTKASCDGAEILRSVSLDDLRRIETMAEREIDHGMLRTDRLGLEGGAHLKSMHSVLELVVESEQRFGKDSASEGELRSVRVVVE